ncbi:CU044_5270 family protein [Micromonospora sp. NPDC047670]|uniref:CU044_5270 family protein n=1 Tax=Micromonospora sp. NPDC047670 TaxID=3364252 RepID=UPI00371FFA95
MIREALDVAREPSANATLRARAALMDRANAVSGGRPAANRGRRAAMGRWWPVAAVGLSGALAAALVVPMIGGPVAPATNGPVRSEPGVTVVADGADAGMVLQLAAAAAPADQALSVRPGQYIYQRSMGAGVSTVGDVDGGGPVARIVESYRYEGWFEPQGMRAQRTRRADGEHRTPLTPADVEAVRKLRYDLNAPPEVLDDGPAPAPSFPADCETCPVVRDPGQLSHPTPGYLASLPTDPAQLLATLRTAVGDQNKHSPDQQVFQAIRELLRQADGIMPPVLRAALYRSIALIPGVRRVEGQVTLGDQKGVAVGLVEDAATDLALRDEIVFDLTGRRLVGMRTVLTRSARGMPAGTVMHWEVIENSVVDRVGQTG